MKKRRQKPALGASVTEPQLVVFGARECVVEQCGAIAEYDDRHVRLAFGKGQIEITGTGLTLVSMTAASVVVRGAFASLAFVGVE